MKEIFPNSKFIVLLRHPYEVVVSTIHMKNTLRKMASLQRYYEDDILSTAKFLNFYYKIVEHYIDTIQEKDFTFMNAKISQII